MTQWAVNYSQDTDVEGEGTVTVSYNGFSTSKRINTNNEQEVDNFVLEARSEMLALEAGKTQKLSIESMILNKLEAE